MSSGVIILECLVLLLNVSSGCLIVKLHQSFYLHCRARECPRRSFLVVELVFFRSFVKGLFFCCVIDFMSSEVSTVIFCKSSNHKWNFNSWWVMFVVFSHIHYLLVLYLFSRYLLVWWLPYLCKDQLDGICFRNMRN